MDYAVSELARRYGTATRRDESCTDSRRDVPGTVSQPTSDGIRPKSSFVERGHVNTNCADDDC